MMATALSKPIDNVTYTRDSRILDGCLDYICVMQSKESVNNVDYNDCNRKESGGRTILVHS